MKRVISIFLLLILCFNINAADKVITPEPYTDEEFSPVLKDARRASIIFCGAFPLGYLYTSLLADTYISVYDPYGDLDSSEKSNKEFELKLFSGLIFAGIVTIIDFIIEKFFLRKNI